MNALIHLKHHGYKPKQPSAESGISALEGNPYYMFRNKRGK